MNIYRYNQYYQMQEIFDGLYNDSSNQVEFKNLMDTIANDNNIRLAFRVIKSNTGSKTAGTDGITIQDFKKESLDEYISLVKNKLNNFKPDTIRRVFIPKENGDNRPLGIPSMIDRLVQQCIKQVLEPICEAKFHPHSYGFRPNRSTKHAIARLNSLVNQAGLHYVVDIDIKGFFDNVSHNKLIKQMIALGIKDFKLLKIIKLMLKAPIQGEGIPNKGTPQGGILSPLLSNIVLNELDWWISSQWETHPTHHEYTQLNKYNAMKKSKLKEFFLVRYADDFKIVCRSYTVAKKIFIAVEEWLGKRLKLKISKEKSKIVNLKKNYSDFLGIKVKVIQRPKSKHGYVAQSRIADKRFNKILQVYRDKIKKIKETQNIKYVAELNSMTLGIHEYYNIATYVSLDFKKINWKLLRYMFNSFNKYGKQEVPNINMTDSIYKKFYGNSKSKTWLMFGKYIYPIHYVKHKSTMNFKQTICDYTMKGREYSNKALKSKTHVLAIEMAKRFNINETVEFNDNRISRASMTNMKCEVTKIELELENIHCHHVIPREMGGDDKYDNLRIVHKDIHMLIHATNEDTIKKYIHKIKDSKNTIKRVLTNLNNLRIKANNYKLEEATVREWLEVKTWKNK
ncbi:group II intron reverse transcriptase/maturase [Tepidibacter sp. Z1-5]|uniref:group II intron reverse transcriptase/maturase n=1 Tax=Tepidibacter sp. Z1-5 TaxID=3134138 RepID=UPI0030BDB233